MKLCVEDGAPGQRLLDVAPVGAEGYFGEDGDAEFGDVFHLLFDEGLQFVASAGRDRCRTGGL